MMLPGEKARASEVQRLGEERRLRIVKRLKELGWTVAWSRAYSGGIAVEMFAGHRMNPGVNPPTFAPDLLVTWSRDGRWLDVFSQVTCSLSIEDLLTEIGRLATGLPARTYHHQPEEII